MNYRLKIYMGTGFDRNGDVVSNSDKITATRHAQEEIVKTTGGCTTVDGVGHYRHADGRIVGESCRIFETCGSDLGQLQLLGRKVARTIRERVNAESVLVTIEEVPEVLFVED